MVETNVIIVIKQESTEKKDTYTKFTYTKDQNDLLINNYGIAEFKTSKGNPEDRFLKKFNSISSINETLKGQEIIIRARLQSSRCKGKTAFLVLREGFFNVQAVMFVGDKISPQMIKFADAIPIESIIEIKGTVTSPDKPVESCTQKTVEISIGTIHCVVDSIPTLPFQLSDANRKINPELEEDGPVVDKKVTPVQQVLTEIVNNEQKELTEEEKKKK